MIRLPIASAGWTAALLALTVCAALSGAAGPASAQVKLTITPPAAPPGPASGPLTLETAVPMAVPPPPAIRAPRPIKAPPRFVAPEVMDAPPAPDLAALAPIAPPPPPASTPPVPAVSSTAPPTEPAERSFDPAEPGPGTQTAAVAPPPRVERPAAAAPAALPPPPASVAPPGDFQVIFHAGATELPASADTVLAAVAERLRDDERLRLQLRSYASGTDEMAREARQLSLTRALAVRERLAAHGISSTRVDIRALGAAATGEPPDRIDVEYLND